jgi:hypothetical protein
LHTRAGGGLFDCLKHEEHLEVNKVEGLMYTRRWYAMEYHGGVAQAMDMKADLS